MTSPADVLAEAARLAGGGKAYVLATVVSVRRPASTRPGDRALITPDGELVGWVGGACSEPIVVREARRALADGSARLVRIGPAGELAGQEPPPGVVLAASHCASEGLVDVLIEPQLPKPLLAIVGESPAARKLAELAAAIGWRVAGELAGAPNAVVVATMGQLDEDALAAALRSSAGYVGLIASSRRAGVVVGSLRERGLTEEELARVRSPAGLDLGPGSQEDIAVAILAELVAWSHTRIADELAGTVAGEAIDPVCGMSVATVGAAYTCDHAGRRYWFCGAGCRARFDSAPDQYATLAQEVSD